MIKFRISGTLPAPWEDFIPEDPSLPRITLMTADNAERCGVEDGDGSDGWVDRVLAVHEIDDAIARATIAEILGVATESIVIEAEGWAQSS